MYWAARSCVALSLALEVIDQARSMPPTVSGLLTPAGAGTGMKWMSGLVCMSPKYQVPSSRKAPCPATNSCTASSPEMPEKPSMK